MEPERKVDASVPIKTDFGVLDPLLGFELLTAFQIMVLLTVFNVT